MIKRLEAEGYRQDEIAEALAFSDKGNGFLLAITAMRTILLS